MALGYIPNDGYTELAVIHEVKGLHPRVQFSFRPMLQAELVDYHKIIDKLQGMELRKLIANHLASKVKSWDLKDHKGETVALTVDNFLRVKEVLFFKLFKVVATDVAPDESPDKDDAEVQAELQDAIKAAEQGKTVAEIREARHKGNL